VVFTCEWTRSTFERAGSPKREEGTTSEIAHVMLPSGDPIWVRVQAAESAATGEQIAGPADVGWGADCTGGRHFASAGIRGDGSGRAYWQRWEAARK
jgi:hypothetical protein